MAKGQYDYSDQLKKEVRGNMLRAVAFVAAGVAVLSLFLHYVLFSVAVKSVSMEPEFSRNAFVFVSPLFAPSKAMVSVLTLERGDVVLVTPIEKTPVPLSRAAVSALVSFVTFRQISLIPSESRGGAALARIAAMPGDTIYLKDYVLYVKPADSAGFRTEFELSTRRYHIIQPSLPEGWDSTLGVSGSLPERTLADDEYFLLCDNRASAIDSRIWGPVAARNIVARAILCYFPFNRFAAV